jgi:glycosyltransferase involved in cell wall biosynthesis
LNFPLVTIICPTYNQEKFIAEALDGFVKQKTNFPFEIIVHDDASTDKTIEIVKKYEKEFSQLFNNIYQNVNQFSQEITRITRLTYKAARGKYIALCEGDDYWTDENKLQKQVDFLEANPGYAICFHGVNVLKDSKEKSSVLNRSDKEETYSILDLAEMNIIHTPSVVFRNGLFDKLPGWFNESPVGDYVLHMLNAKKGLIKYFPETMAVYRVHDSGVWGQPGTPVNHAKWLWVLNKLQQEDFDEAVIKRISAQKNKTFNEYIEWLLYKKDFPLIIESYRKLYNKSELFDTDFIINILSAKLSELNNELDEIKSSNAYKRLKRMSFYKYRLSKLLSKK